MAPLIGLLTLSLLCATGGLTAAPLSQELPAFGYLKETVGRGIGYKKSYTTLGLFFSLSSRCIRPFLDLRIHRFSNNKWALNAGGGVRFFIPELNRAFGINCYYDSRRAKHRYKQVGVGFEMLGPRFDVRINGYFPTGRTHKWHPTLTRYPGGYWIRFKHKRHALRGVDGEIATSFKKLFPCWSRCWDIYFAAGAYAFPVEHCDNATGGKFRLGISFLDCISMELKVSDDRYFGTRVQGIFACSFPLYSIKDTCCESCCDCEPFTNIPPDRQEIIVLDKTRCSWKANF